MLSNHPVVSPAGAISDCLRGLLGQSAAPLSLVQVGFNGSEWPCCLAVAAQAQKCEGAQMQAGRQANLSGSGGLLRRWIARVRGVTVVRSYT